MGGLLNGDVQRAWFFVACLLFSCFYATCHQKRDINPSRI